MAKQWTKDEDDILRGMREANFSYHECAATLRRTVGACQQRAHLKGLSKTQVRESPKRQTELVSQPTWFRALLNKLLGR